MDLVCFILFALKVSGKHLVRLGFKRAISFLVSVSLVSSNSHPAALVSLIEMAHLLEEITGSSHFAR